MGWLCARPCAPGLGMGLPITLSPQSYLQAFEYKNTVYQDLWSHLQKVGVAHGRERVPSSSPQAWAAHL